MAQLVFSIRWYLEEIGSNASAGMNFLARQEQAGKERKLPSSVSSILAEGMAQI